MAISVILNTPRLFIEPFTEKHLADRYVAWLNDPEVVQYSDQRFSTHTPDSCRSYLHSFEDTQNYYWAIVARDLDLGHIGNVTAYVDTNHQVADIGILIGETKAWGKGYGTEAWRAVCDYLFRTVGLRKITAGTIAPNVQMIKIMERTGMQIEGRRIRQNIWADQEVDMLYAGMFRCDWLQRNTVPFFQV